MTLDIHKLGRSIIVFSETDSRLKLELSPGEEPHNGMKGHLQIPDAGDIQCLEIVDENSTAAVQLPRLINIYSRISQRTAARTFWGVLDHSGKRYAVMESLDGSTRLEDAYDSPGRSATQSSISTRLIILLKSLSSQNLYIRQPKSENNHIRPILTDLENARLVRISHLSSFRRQALIAPDHREHCRARIRCSV
jgi:hypothetical protein